MANLIDLQFNLSETVEEIASLPVEHWECWIIQLLMDLEKKATQQGQQSEFRAMLATVNKDIANRLGDEQW